MHRNEWRLPPVSRGRGAFLAVLFFGGSTLLPGLHVAFHDNHHSHEGGGIHRHDDGDDDDDDAPSPWGAADYGHSHRPGHDHGDGSLAHFAAALGDGVEPAASLADLGPAASPPFDDPAFPPLARSSRGHPDVRGPPALLPD